MFQALTASFTATTLWIIQEVQERFLCNSVHPPASWHDKLMARRKCPKTSITHKSSTQFIHGHGIICTVPADHGAKFTCALCPIQIPGILFRAEQVEAWFQEVQYVSLMSIHYLIDKEFRRIRKKGESQRILCWICLRAVPLGKSKCEESFLSGEKRFTG